MFRRSVRIACLVVGLLATAGLTYRALQDEDALDRERQSSAARATAVAHASELLFDLRASLHAYVAPAQGLPFWSKRAQEAIDQLRQRLTELDTQVSAGGSLTESLKAVDDLTAAERRARAHVNRGELQLAGDVIFTEVRDLVGSITADLDEVRVAVAREGLVHLGPHDLASIDSGPRIGGDGRRRGFRGCRRSRRRAPRASGVVHSSARIGTRPGTPPTQNTERAARLVSIGSGR